MNLNLEKVVMYGIPIWTLIAIFLLSPNLGTASLNRAFALASVVVLGITFIIGPVGKFSKTANRLKIYRKYLGLAGFALVVIHTLLSVVFYFDLNIAYMMSFERAGALQFYSALMAFLIFFLMSITSTSEAIKLMGARNWKLLQTSGYIAMALVMLHFMLANTNAAFHIGRSYALITFAFGIVVVVARIFVYLLTTYEKISRKK